MNRSVRLPSNERDTLWDRAYASIKSDLLAGRLAPGHRLVLRQVADELGISLTPVRDAVNRLIAEKILDHGGLGQGGGAIVPLLDANEFNQLMTVRIALEPGAAAAAALHTTARELAAIEAELTEMKRSVKENRTDEYLQAHHQFHFRIYAMCRMPIVQEIIETAWLRCGPTLTLALPEYIPGLKRYQSHMDTLAALHKGDGERAATAIRADIESARTDIVALLEKSDRR